MGMPRIGNSAFSTWAKGLLKDKMIRIINQNDLTPHLPLKFAGFLNFGLEIWIKNSIGVTIECPVEITGESDECSNSKSIYDISKHGHGWNNSIIGHKSC